MTSNKSEVNLKSTAYNQNGQNYFEQLAAYNAMSVHLRRTLLAKCVVNARNKDYIRKRRQISKETDCKSRISGTNIQNYILDRLAYDTLYHPTDFLSPYFDSRYFFPHAAHKGTGNSCNYHTTYSRSKLNSRTACSNSPILKANDPEPCTSNSTNLTPRSSTTSKKVSIPVNPKSALKVHDRSKETPSLVGSTPELRPKEINNSLSALNTSRSCDNYESAQAHSNVLDYQEVYIRNKEAKYANFVYEITHEIILNGLYTDKELEEVFDKHIEENRKILDMNRMLYEIYQLKLALNISDNSGSDELQDLAPVSLKVSNENRPTEELLWNQKLEGFDRDLPTYSNKSVVSIDANSELLVTERDVLVSLIEANINPEQALQIYKSLSDRSKDSSLPIEANVKLSNVEFLEEKSGQFDHADVVSRGIENAEKRKKYSKS